MAGDLSFTIKCNDTGTVTVEKFQRSVDQATQSVQGMGNALATIKWDAITNLIEKAYGALKKIYDLGQQGALLLQLESSFKNVAMAAGISSESMLASLNKATVGMVSDTALMRGAMKGLLEGLSPDQILRIAEATTVLAQRAGISIEDAYKSTEKMSDLMIRGLKAMGIQAQDAYKDYAMAYGMSSKDLTEFGKVLALVAVWEKKAAEEQQKFGTGMVETASKMQQTGKFFSDVWDGFLKVMAYVAVAIGGFFTGIYTAIVSVIDGISKLFDWIATKLTAFSNIPLVKKVLGIGAATSPAEAEALLMAGGVPTGESPATGIEKAAATKLPTITAPVLGGAPVAGAFRPTSGMGAAKDWVAEIKKQYDADIANLEVWAEQEKTATQRALSELDVMRAQHLVNESEYIDQKLNIEQQGTTKLLQSIEDEKTTTIESYSWMIADLQKTHTKTIEEKSKLTAQVLALKDEENKKLADLTKKGLALQEQLLKESDQRLIAEIKLTEELQVASNQAVFDRQKLIIQGQSQLAQAKAGTGAISSGQAAMIDYQNQLKLMDVEKKSLQFTLDHSNDLKVIEDTENKLLALEIQRSNLTKAMAETLKSETAPAYQGLLDGLQKYVTSSGTLYTQLKDMTNSLASGMASAFSNFFQSIFDNTKTWSQKMQGLFKGLANAFIKALSEMAAKALVTSLFGTSATSTSPGTSGLLGTIGRWLGLGTSTPAPALQAPSYINLTGLQTGTNYVPETGLYGLHKGEAVVPAEYNKPGQGDGGQTIINHNYFGVTDAEGYRRMALQNKDLHQGMALAAFADSKRQNLQGTR